VVRAFGALLRTEAVGPSVVEEAALADALDRLRLDRLRHAHVLAADPREHPDVWELNGALVALVDGMLLDLDADADIRHQDGPSELPVERQAAQLRKLLGVRRLTGERSSHRAADENRRPDARKEDTGDGEAPDGRDRPAEASDADPLRRPLADP
jgi:hypothetical protein